MISPDGRRLAGDWNSEISVLDLANGVATQLTFPPSWAQNPIWSSDGQYVAYNKDRGIFRRPASGAGAEELLVRSDTLAVPKSWSPDGRFMLYAQINSRTGADLLAIPVPGDGRDGRFQNSRIAGCFPLSPLPAARHRRGPSQSMATSTSSSPATSTR